MRRPVVAAIVAATSFALFGGTASAGEWGPGNGLTPIKAQQECDESACPKPAGPAKSVCAFNGRDQPDVSETNPDGEPEPDDGLWGSTPAKGKVQSGGQFVAMYANVGPGVVAGAVAAGEFGGFGGDCNPNSGHEEP